MTIFTTFVSLTDLTTMRAAEISLLAAADGASAKDGVLEVPAEVLRIAGCNAFHTSPVSRRNLTPGAICNLSAGYVVPASEHGASYD